MHISCLTSIVLILANFVWADSSTRDTTEQCIDDKVTIVHGRKCTQKCGQDYPGRAYRTVGSSSLDNCEKACGRDSRCLAAVYLSSKQKCYLKSSLPESRSDTGVNSTICAKPSPETCQGPFFTCPSKPGSNDNNDACLCIKAVSGGNVGTFIDAHVVCRSLSVCDAKNQCPTGYVCSQLGCCSEFGPNAKLCLPLPSAGGGCFATSASPLMVNMLMSEGERPQTIGGV